MNGRGRFNCSLAASGTCNASHPECAALTLTVVLGKTYLLRIASITSLSALNFEIEVQFVHILFNYLSNERHSPTCSR